MEPYLSQIGDIEKISRNYRSFANFYDGKFPTIRASLSDLKCILLDHFLNLDILESIISLQKLVKDTVAELSYEHRNIHPSVSKFGKAIEKHFLQDFSYLISIGLSKNLGRCNFLHQSIQIYLCRYGLLYSIGHFASERVMIFCKEQEQLFLEINRISQSILLKNVHPALEWCKLNRTQLKSIGSVLEMMLFEVHFVFLMMSGNIESALQFANSMYHLVHIDSDHIQKILGYLAFANCSLKNTPYGSIYSDDSWVNTALVFKRDAYILENIPVSCPMASSISAACQSIPTLVKMKIVIQQQDRYEVLSKYDELPIDIDLEPCLRFHSIFACPILRQQAFDSASQPVRLICGHLIGLESMKKILTSHGEVKCPYCPLQMHESEVMHIIL